MGTMQPDDTTAEYGLVIDHECDEDRLFYLVKRSLLSKHAASIQLTSQQVSEFHRIHDAWRIWQDKFASAYDACRDKHVCPSCGGSGVRREDNDTQS